MGERIVIAGMGAATAVGRGAWESATAVRAGISGFTQHPYMIDTAGEPMRVALAPWLDIALQGVERFEALLMPAVEEALASLGPPQTAPRRWAIALALPTPRPGLPEKLPGELLARINRRWGSLFASAAVFDAGHAAGLLGVHAALGKLRAGHLDACLVAGVESYMEPETLEWLEENDQLHGGGPLNNAWGFIPGEAGAAILLAREDVARADGFEPLASVLAAGTAFEPKRIKTETVCIGEGLTEAFRAALAALPEGVKVTDIYCDMNGEPYRADEFGITVLRTKDHFESASNFVAPADCWGDVSAAGSLLQLVLACAAARKRYASGPVAMAWASAERGERAPAVVATGG